MMQPDAKTQMISAVEVEVACINIIHVFIEDNSKH